MCFYAPPRAPAGADRDTHPAARDDRKERDADEPVAAVDEVSPHPASVALPALAAAH